MAFEAEARMNEGSGLRMLGRHLVDVELMEQINYFEDKKRMRLTQGNINRR